MLRESMMERLQKIIARAGIASRRKAEELILEGAVRVNGQVIRELGARADPRRDHIRVHGKMIRPQPLEYFALNKPRGVISSVSDDKGRVSVTDLVNTSVRVHPAGRLDYDSEGLMILTNDGTLTRRLTRGGSVAKVYRVKVRGEPAEAVLDKLRKGFVLGREQFAPCEIRMAKPGNNAWLQVTLRQGKNRQIRRMFDSIGHRVMRLRRVAIGPIRLGKLRPGEVRKLTAGEVKKLYADS